MTPCAPPISQDGSVSLRPYSRRVRERKTVAFSKVRGHIFKRTEYKRSRKVKVFGLTTTTGKVLVCRTRMHPDATDWIKLVHRRVGPFLKREFPDRKWKTIILDGETLFHTPDAVAAMKQWGIRPLPGWPANSPDLNPQENVWGWAEPQLRKIEAMGDSFETLAKRVPCAWRQIIVDESCFLILNAGKARGGHVGGELDILLTIRHR